MIRASRGARRRAWGVLAELPRTARLLMAPALISALLLSGLLTAPSRVVAQSAPIEDLAHFPRTKVEVHSTGKSAETHTFDMWVANTPARSEQGLMFVTEIPVGRGMIFPVDPPHVMTMWMKNCPSSMDMVFVSTKGRISKIIARAKPQSEDTLSSDNVVGAVLEIGPGEAERLHLQVGDAVSWSLSK